jgi:hypothetical protein
MTALMGRSSPPPIAAVDDPITSLDDQTVELVRACLHQVPEYNRAALWDRLSALRAALLGGRDWHAEGIVRQAPHGPIQDCLAAVARSMHVPRRELVVSEDVPRRGRQRADSLGFYKGFAAVAGPVGIWSMNRTGLYYEKTDPDAYSAVPTGQGRHVPVQLNYGHQPDSVAGCSRGWALDSDGSLRMVGQWGSWPEAQLLARNAELGLLGISVETEYQVHWVAHPSPQEWEPRDGVVDLCHFDHARMVGVAVTPRPAYPQAIIMKVW